MSLKASFLPITNIEQARAVAAICESEVAGQHGLWFEYAAITKQPLTIFGVPQGTPDADGNYAYVAFTSEGWLDVTYDGGPSFDELYPAFQGTFPLAEVLADECFDEDGMKGATHFAEFPQFLAALAGTVPVTA